MNQNTLNSFRIIRLSYFWTWKDLEDPLKVLPPELVADEERKHRFVLEAQATAAPKHPNVAVIYEVDVVDVTFIAMELIDGSNLSALLTEALCRSPKRCS